jgi:hypothetical protein
MPRGLFRTKFSRGGWRRTDKERRLAYLLVTFAPLTRGPDHPPPSRVTTSYVSQTHTNENISPLEGIVNLFYPTAKAKKLNDKYTTVRGQRIERITVIRLN